MQSVLSKKVTIKDSKIDGCGMFAEEKILKGEMVFIKGGHILRRDEFISSGIINSYQPIGNDYFLAAATLDEESRIKLHINHSCNPNCGLHGEITFVAIQDIEAGDELTIDYAFVDDEDYSFECSCGSANCRGTITGYDWKKFTPKSPLFNYFAVYLQDKIYLQGGQE